MQSGLAYPAVERKTGVSELSARFFPNSVFFPHRPSPATGARGAPGGRRRRSKTYHRLLASVPKPPAVTELLACDQHQVDHQLTLARAACLTAAGADRRSTTSCWPPRRRRWPSSCYWPAISTRWIITCSWGLRRPAAAIVQSYPSMRITVRVEVAEDQLQGNSSQPCNQWLPHSLLKGGSFYRGLGTNLTSPQAENISGSTSSLRGTPRASASSPMLSIDTLRTPRSTSLTYVRLRSERKANSS